MIMNKILNKLENNYYGVVANHCMLNFDIKKYIKILNDYDRVQSAPTPLDDNEYLLPQDGIIAIKDKSGNVYDIYYKNLHFHVVDTQSEDIVQMFIKSDEEQWKIVKKGNTYDVSNPDTKFIEIFYSFDIETMHEFRCSNADYKKGSWNEYVVKTLKEFEEIVDSLTVETFVTNAYKNYK